MAFLFLLIEFFDELHYGIQGAVLPSLRLDLGLSYAQVGLLLGLPHVIGTLIEPIVMLLGDTRLRKALVVGGGLAITLALLMIGTSQSFGLLLLAFVISFPASGAFVTLAQATLMDLNPGREPHMMARWTVFGSLGNLVGPLLVSAGFGLAFGWRWSYGMLVVLCLALTLNTWARRFPSANPDTAGSADHSDFRSLLPGLWSAIRNLSLLRWLALLEFSDLLLDIFAGYAALYFADVVGFSPSQVGLLLGVMMAASLSADLLVIPLLERLPGRKLVRVSAAVSAPLFTMLLLAPWPLVKAALAVLVRFSTLGWYQVLQGEAYASLPGRSGTVMAVNSLAGLLSGAIAWFIGWIANQAGLPTAMWLLLAGPLFLLIFVPKRLPEKKGI